MDLAFWARWGGAAAALIVCGAAMGVGGAPRRAGALILLAWVLTPLVADWGRPDGIHWGVFAVDLALWIGLTALYARRPRLWLLAAAGFQVTVVLSHPVMLAGGSDLARAYASTNWLFGYLQLIALSLGVVLDRPKRNGAG